jgi:hypothetical protein
MLRQLIHFQEGEVYPVSRVLISIKQLIYSSLHMLQQDFLCWTRPLNTSLLLGTLTDLARGKSELVAENALLRQQLIILLRQVKRPACRKSDRFLLLLLARMIRTWKQALFIVQPETMLTLASGTVPSVLEVQVTSSFETAEALSRDNRIDQGDGK